MKRPDQVFHFLRQMIAKLRHRPNMVSSLMRGYRPPAPPEDPYAAVREPNRRGPGGRSSAVAVAEPEPERGIRAVGTPRDR